jgi:hypothetical protein
MFRGSINSKLSKCTFLASRGGSRIALGPARRQAEEMIEVAFLQQVRRKQAEGLQ